MTIKDLDKRLELGILANDLGIQLLVGTPINKHMTGMHMINPIIEELEKAIVDYARYNSFGVIYVHRVKEK